MANAARRNAGTPPKKGRDPLLAAICHDLRAPLAAVTMGTNFVLQTTDAENDRSRRILEAMLRSCAQMERLIRDFADLSEIEGDAVELRLGVHDAGEMLDFAREALNELAASRDVTIEVDKPEHPVVLTCDRERVLRLLHHLLDNALKFAPPKSKVTLAVRRDNGTATFSVIDHGTGLSKEVKKNLFDRQWHARRANRVGAGLGLAIARGFAEAHDGSLHVESRPGEETTFTFTLPIRRGNVSSGSGSARRRR